MTAVGVTGHQDLPSEAVDYIIHAMRRQLETIATPLLGWTSLAAGADQIFADLVLSIGGALHVVLPCDHYDTTFTRETDRHRYEAYLAAAQHVVTLGFPSPSEDAFLSAGHAIADGVDELLAVWDGLPPRGRGGTADVVAYAQRLGKSVTVIWPDGVRR
jgi:hypothetical protein